MAARLGLGIGFRMMSRAVILYNVQLPNVSTLRKSESTSPPAPPFHLYAALLEACCIQRGPHLLQLFLAFVCSIEFQLALGPANCRHNLTVPRIVYYNLHPLLPTIHKIGPYKMHRFF